MNKRVTIIFAAILAVVIFNQDSILEYLGFKQKVNHATPTLTTPKKERISPKTKIEGDSFVSDTIYQWDEQILDWVITNKPLDFRAQYVNTTASSHSFSEPIEVDWKILMDIQYKLQYFSEIEMEMYAPVFSKAVKALHGKDVIIEGFVIPFDEEEELLSLSFNPYSSCFFCGKASPASVISMYLKNKRKRYKIDDFKKFRGTLFLNHDDPNQFYYILRDAKEI